MIGLTSEQKRAVYARIAPPAVVCERTTGVPAELIVAQCILESGWLLHMPEGSNNPFGIKAVHDEDGVLSPTTEWFTPAQLAAFLAKGNGRTADLQRDDRGVAITSKTGRAKYRVLDYFQRYPTLEDAFVAHARLIAFGAPYHDAMIAFRTDGDLPAFIERVAAKYATDEAYAPTILAFVRNTVMQQALQAARA